MFRGFGRFGRADDINRINVTNRQIPSDYSAFANVLGAYKDGASLKQQQEEYAKKQQKEALLSAAGEAYAGGDTQGFKNNLAGADLAKLLSYDTNQQQMSSENDFRNRQLGLQERNMASQNNYNNALLGLKREKLMSQLNEGGASKESLRSAAQDAINQLSGIGARGGIGKWSNKAGGIWADEQEIGRRDAALSSLIPLTNEIAKASGGSGINTLGEMMAYLGIPENSTSDAIVGALPQIAGKLGLNYKDVTLAKKSSSNLLNAKNSFFGRSGGATKPTQIGGFMIEEIE